MDMLYFLLFSACLCQFPLIIMREGFMAGFLYGFIDINSV